jgi:hypothetical protein
MDSDPRREVANRLPRVEFLGAQWDLLGRIMSERGVQALAIQGMPNGRTENRLTADMAALAYSPRRSTDAKYRWGRQPSRSLRPLSVITSGCSFKMLAGGPFASSYCILSADFLASLGVSLRGWVAELCLAEARRRLIETDLPIGEVAWRCAFQSVAAFRTAFRASVGCAPGAFRRMAAD